MRCGYYLTECNHFKGQEQRPPEEETAHYTELIKAVILSRRHRLLGKQFPWKILRNGKYLEGGAVLATIDRYIYIRYTLSAECIHEQNMIDIHHQGL